MARSKKIYLVYVLSLNRSSLFPEAAFTVKHEAISYIRRQLPLLSPIEQIKLYGGTDGSRPDMWKEIKLDT